MKVIGIVKCNNSTNYYYLQTNNKEEYYFPPRLEKEATSLVGKSIFVEINNIKGVRSIVRILDRY